MRPTEVLMKEHDSILEMLGVLESAAGNLEKGEPAAPEHLEQMLSFLKGYADRCHHGKEEDLLFPAMERVGIPREGGPIGVMLHEHAQGRECIQRMGEAASALKGGDPQASSAFAQAARAYVSLLRQHIEKENNILFRMADAHLSPQDQEELSQRFAEADERNIGSEQIARYLRELDELKRVYA